MPFNSVAFLVGFLPAVVLVARLLVSLQRVAAFQWWLAIATLAFYAWTEAAYVPLLVASIRVNWGVVLAMKNAAERARLTWLWVGISLNLSALFYFKYAGFAVDALQALGMGAVQSERTHFPLGLSFFIIQQIMLLVDAYEGLLPSYRMREAFSFVAFFPYLLLGPISRAKQIIPQLNSPDLSRFRMREALALIVIGLAKKVLIADNIGLLVNQIFGAGPEWNIVEAWIAAIGFAVQLYFDFSGYTDIAIGSAKLLGVGLPQNFNAPFRAKSVAEFWQRWHITLTQFINTYLFTPIVRRLGKVTLRTSALATLTSMLIAGLWHGPSWTYVVFGGLHGIALCVNQYTKKKKLKSPAWLAHSMTLVFLIAAFVVFRSPSLSFAATALKSLVGAHGFSASVAWPADLPPMYALMVLTLGSFAAFYGPTSEQWAERISASSQATMTVVAMSAAATAVMLSVIKSQFVYNQF